MLHVNSHCSFFGNSGFNIYSQGFFRALKQIYPNVSVRNFTALPDTEIESGDKKLITSITALDKYNTTDTYIASWHIPPPNNQFGQIDLIFNETNHPYFYERYDNFKIAYNMWETTKQPTEFFNKLLEFNQIWVPSNWQKTMLINQGYPTEKIFVVPGGVDKEFKPTKKPNKRKKNKVNFLIVGAWGFRKATVEMIKSFLTVFKNNTNVLLTLAVDAPFNKDGLQSTEERLKHYGLTSNKIKIQHFTDRASYIKLIQNCDVFLACSRGEGWNLPLIEALACGKPAIFSDCSSHLEYTSGYPLKVDIKKEVPAVYKPEQIDFTGNYYEPDFSQFKKLLKDVYNNIDNYTEQHIQLSHQLREKYTWQNSAKIAADLLTQTMLTSEKCNTFYVNKEQKQSLSVTGSGMDDSIFREVFQFNIYNDMLEMQIKPGDVVMDIGAHIGIFSRYAAICGAARVVSFEMNPSYFSALQLNVRPEDDIFNCVILDKQFTTYNLKNGTSINGFNINHFFNGGLFSKIDFLKIDVAGTELRILRSITKAVFEVINKVSVKLYGTTNETKLELIKYMKDNNFVNYHNIITANDLVQVIYFWK